MAQMCEPDQAIKEQLHLLSGLIRQQSEYPGREFVVTASLFSELSAFEQQVLSLVPSGIKGKCNAIMEYVAKHSMYPGSNVSINPALDYPIGFCKSEEEFDFYLHHLEALKQLQILGTDNNDDLVVVITATAWQELEGKSYRVDSDQCFVAMWFDRTLDELFVHAIKPLEKTTGFRMLRIDMAQFNDKICDRIVAEIRKSRFMIADVTGHRHAVYFEAGYAMGFGVPVIWTCQRSQIGECPNFDTRQYNHILWDTPEELVEKLDARISATVGRKI